MRSIFLIPAAIIVPFTMIYFLKMITGDPLSAVFLALIIFITLAAWFAGSAVNTDRRSVKGGQG